MIQIPTFSLTQRIVTDEGRPTADYLRALNGVIVALAKQGGTNAELIEQITDALEKVGIAVENAENATAAANAANVEAALVQSYVVEADVLTASITGTVATITIAAHTRKYGDGKSVPVAGGSITGLAAETQYYIYYNDAQREGGTVTYVATTNSGDAGQTGIRHLVGGYATPAVGGTGGGGGTTPPPGIPSWKFPEERNTVPLD